MKKYLPKIIVRLALSALLLWAAVAPVSGCKVEQPGSKQEPVDAAAKVAAVMADNGITLPQVAAYLNTYGYDVVSRAQTRRLHWRAAPPGRDAQGNVVPVAYYVAAVRIAVGDTALTVYAPAGVGEIAAKVKAYDGRGMTGPWSESAVSGPGALLPGVVE